MRSNPPIVGIGASAGGVEALEQFFKAVPADHGMAFVVVTHLSPSHESMLAEIIGRATPMPVFNALSTRNGGEVTISDRNGTMNISAISWLLAVTSWKQFSGSLVEQFGSANKPGLIQLE